MRDNTYTVQCAEPGCREYTRRERRSARDERRFGARATTPWRCIRHACPEEWLTPTNARRVVKLTARTLKTSHRYWVRENATTGSGFVSGPGFSASTDEFPVGTILIVTVEAIAPEPNK